MSEIAKCPVCGNEPKIKHWSSEDGDVSIHCCGVTIDGGEKLWAQYAAAMGLAKALNEMDKLDAEMRSTGCVSDELRNKRISAHRRISNAMDKRAEVFK